MRYNTANPQLDRIEVPMPRLLIAALLSLAIVSAPTPAHAVYFVDQGDTLSIQVKDTPQYSYVGQIRPDGVITIPFLGEVEVAGLTTGQVENRVKAALKAYLRNPEVSVSVTGFRPQYVTVLGQVARPGVIQIPRPKPTLFDILAAAGGMTERAVSWEVVVLRGTGPNAKTYTVNVQEMERTANFENNIAIEPGDRIQVREVWWPDLREWRRDIVAVLGFFASIAALLALYDRASRGSGQ